MQCLLVIAGLSACAVPPAPAPLMIPNTGAAGGDSPAVQMAIEPSTAVFRVMEYPLVEQSTDTPNHPDFAARAVEAVAARRAGFGLFHSVDAVEEPNRLLEPFGYQIVPSATPPFSSYSLYQHGVLIVDEIGRFWPVQTQGSDNFALVLETLSGDRLAASNGGLETLSLSAETDDRLAYAGGGNMPLITSENSTQASFEGSIFHQQIQGQELVLYNRDLLTHINYAGQDLPFVYDDLVLGNTPETLMYRPGASGQVVWFYALRDGLWYYVEAGLME